MSKINQIEQELPKWRGLYFLEYTTQKSEIVSKNFKRFEKMINEEKNWLYFKCLC